MTNRLLDLLVSRVKSGDALHMVVNAMTNDGSAEIINAFDNLQSIHSESGFAGTFLQNASGPTSI